ncbi:SanA/YdcF family protein [Catellatospora citrea]|uniref:Membrane protein n=1 Tax=Catellatospora citrea TaxID=53366 RepID=A0A8J3KSZ1_9ACTN|nr:ElyC/SanA/YdcF family protein [Catellatospora citrea]RKE06403.1 vancomycin permeability regulator SanA [Catellatospora citrea]GIG02616.1 membrane protein [Catellatospora citrea]
MTSDQEQPESAPAGAAQAEPSGSTAPARGRRRWWRVTRRVVLLSVLAGLLALVGSIGWVRWQASGHVYAIEDVPEAPVALVLGAQVHDNGSPSGFLEARLDIARRLYETGKVRAVLVSGDHGQWTYDEPDAMRQWLIDRGVPDRKVVADHAGFDTYDSCQRAVRVFGVRQLIVVTQSYHIDRAVALCRDAGIDAAGVGDDTARRFGSFWTKAVVREQGACVKAMLDVVTGRDPVFLGRHETGVEDALRD